ncbi:MAG: adenylosuccinate lyase [Candidatus Promineifilaceae bacterium]
MGIDMSFSHETFISPFTWRYGSPEMRRIWSEEQKRLLMRRVWVALATAQHKAGLVSSAQLADLRAQMNRVDINRALEIEQETHHDVIAEIRAYAEQCPVGGGIIHLGATSADITDNVDVIRMRDSVELLLQRLNTLLDHFADKIEAFADEPAMALTHIQPAEPTTLGYRFAVYSQDLLEEWEELDRVRSRLRGKGFKGAVGTQASYTALLEGTGVSPGEMEAEAMAVLGLPTFPIATQTYSRQQDLRLLSVLATLAAALHKFALDFRILQSPPFGEWSEPFEPGQVGSSAMPFKRNPINAENICSLARYVAALPAIAWNNASQAVLERSLDDSANRRVYLAEAFLACDDMVVRAGRILGGMKIDQAAIQRNMIRYGPFAATERVLMAAVAAGADRQEAHDWLRQASLQAWEAVGKGLENPLPALLEADERLTRYLPPTQIRSLMDVRTYTGTAAERALTLAGKIRERTRQLT